MAPEPDRMTIDELAHRSGTAASTIRLYQTRRLLPPPRKEGRVGYYGEGHLARLRLISQLQAEGFSLASIGRLVDAWETGRGLDAVLGLEEQVTATWGDEQPLHLAVQELATRLPGAELMPEQLRRAVELGLIETDGDGLVVTTPRFLDLGSELVRLGIPLDDVLDEYGHLQEATRLVAEQFTQLFARHLWAPFVQSGLPEGEVRHLTEVLQRLNALAENVLVLTLRRSLKRAASAFLAAQAERLDGSDALDTLGPLAAAAGLDLEDRSAPG